MKKILKLTPFLFLVLFSLNVNSQTSEVKQLQDKIEEWNNYGTTDPSLIQMKNDYNNCK